jgi:hypothetical protein
MNYNIFKRELTLTYFNVFFKDFLLFILIISL